MRVFLFIAACIAAVVALISDTRSITTTPPRRSSHSATTNLLLIQTSGLHTMDTVTADMLKLDEQIIDAFIKRFQSRFGRGIYSRSYGNFKDRCGNNISYLEYRLSKEESSENFANSRKRLGDVPFFPKLVNHSLKKRIQHININDIVYNHYDRILYGSALRSL